MKMEHLTSLIDSTAQGSPGAVRVLLEIAETDPMFLNPLGIAMKMTEGINMTEPKTLVTQEALRAIANEQVKLENEIYGVLCKYLPQYERRGFNFHSRAQTIAAFAGKQFVEWAQANLQIEVGTK